MAAETTNAAKFTDYMKAAPAGYSEIVIDDDVTDAAVSEANDRLNLACIDEGKTIVNIRVWENEDGDSHATPTLDGDIVLVQGVDDPSEDGTETVLYNAGTRWQAASTTLVESFKNTKLEAKGYNGKAYIRFKCVTAAATAVGGFGVKLTIGIQ